MATKLTLALEELNFAEIKSKYKNVASPVLGKIVRFKCSINIYFAILVHIGRKIFLRMEANFFFQTLSR